MVVLAERPLSTSHSKRSRLETLVFGSDAHFSDSDGDGGSHIPAHCTDGNSSVKLEKSCAAVAEEFSDHDDNDEILRERDTADSCCVWRDSDDEVDCDGDSLKVAIQSEPKLRKLRLFGDASSVHLTPLELQKRLQKFKTSKTGASEWATRLREATAKDGGHVFSDGDDDDKEQQVARKAKVTHIARTSTRVLGCFDAQPLRPGALSYRVLPDLNRKNPSQSAVSACGFIRGMPLFFAAGLDKSIRLFKTDSPDHEKHASYHLKDRQIKSAFELTTWAGPSILFLAGVRSIGVLDVQSGSVTMLRSFSAARRYQRVSALCPAGGTSGLFATLADNGHVLCCDSRMQCVAANYKMNVEGRALTYLAGDENHLFTGDAEGTVYDWDLKAGRCVASFHDEGSHGVTALCSAPYSFTASYLAVGSTSGYVNIYDIRRHVIEDRSTLSLEAPTSLFDTENDAWGASMQNSAQPVSLQTTESTAFSTSFKPLKSLDHLTTAVTSLAFHPSFKLLVMGSKYTKELVKLVHLPSFTVFNNFPRQDNALNLKYPESVAFNASGSSFVVGNSHGLVKHFELHHFLQPKRSRKQH